MSSWVKDMEESRSHMSAAQRAELAREELARIKALADSDNRDAQALAAVLRQIFEETGIGMYGFTSSPTGRQNTVHFGDGHVSLSYPEAIGYAAGLLAAALADKHRDAQGR